MLLWAEARGAFIKAARGELRACCAQTGQTGPVVKRQFDVQPGRLAERKQVSLSFSLNWSFENIQELFFFFYLFEVTANANEHMLRMKYVWN